MKPNQKLLLTGISLLVLAFLVCSQPAPTVQVTSLGGTASIQLSIEKECARGKNVPVYAVSFHGEPVIVSSPLGLVLKNGVALDQNLKIVSFEKTTVDETYSPVVGKHRTIRNQYRQATVTLETTNSPIYKLKIHLRAYDDGVALRYELPAQPDITDFTITAEQTTFRLAADYQAWVLPLNKYTSNYETNYTPGPVSQIPKETIMGLPLTLEAATGHCLAITEANLTDYAGMYLCPCQNDSLGLRTCLAPSPTDEKVKVQGTTPHLSPWRVIMHGETPGDLIESEIVLNLNEPCAIENPEWIKAGLVAWDWWAKQTVKNVNFEGGMNTATMKHYIDFAGEMGWEYMLIDAGWYGNHRDGQADITQPIEAVDLPAIIRHASDKNVDILLWVNWGCVERQMTEAFPLYEKWGVKGIKVDYMNRDDQEMVDYYHRVVKLAAKHHLLVDFHGAYKPTGIRRTWPNLMTREGVLGLEYSRWSERVTPQHDLIIPFTRMLAGPMDYTPGAFRNAFEPDFEVTEEPGSQGTRCHQLAMYVVYESPLQMCVDYPTAYRNQPGIEFLRHVPATWDDTRLLNGKIGEYITVARLSGEEWYLGSMSNSEPRSLEVPLDFLGDKKYQASIFADEVGGPATAVVFSEKVVTNQDVLTINLASGGGCAVRLVPMEP